MKRLTAELEGPALDWAVAKAWQPVYSDKHLAEHTKGFKPSTDWAHGGPVIEREGIRVYRVFAPHGPSWSADMRDADGHIRHWAHGPTTLIAAMRCYVASVLGDGIELPEEL